MKDIYDIMGYFMKKIHVIIITSIFLITIFTAVESEKNNNILSKNEYPSLHIVKTDIKKPGIEKIDYVPRNFKTANEGYNYIIITKGDVIIVMVSCIRPIK